jgi:predicted AlkP superfamily phosphohydrolase/phosphomutase
MNNRIWFYAVAATVFLAVSGTASAQQPIATKKPRVILLGVNGAEWDIIKPLLVRGEMPNLAWVISRGVSGKLRTVSAPNCPKIYSIFETSRPPEENGITGFRVNGETAVSSLLKVPPLWSLLSNAGISVGMANVPATFPAPPVNGYLITGMLTHGKGCEDGMLCSPKLSQVQDGDATFPKTLAREIVNDLGDIPIDCSRMPGEAELRGHEAEAVNRWIENVSQIRKQQQRLFDYLLTKRPTDFTFFVQSCEDRVGHWLYPIQPHNAGYNPRIHSLRVDAFPNQYRELDKVLGTILKHVDTDTTLIILSDHGIKPLREIESHDAHRDHAGTTPVIAKHDFEDGDDVPGLFIAMGPGIKREVRIMGLGMSVYDLAPTILHIYGLSPLPSMKGRILTEIFEERKETATATQEGSTRH